MSEEKLSRVRYGDAFFWRKTGTHKPGTPLSVLQIWRSVVYAPAARLVSSPSIHHSREDRRERTKPPAALTVVEGLISPFSRALGHTPSVDFC